MMSKVLKVLVLIIASDQLPVYQAEQQIWRSYMHYNPEQIEAYFIKADPALPTLYAVDGDIIWSRTSETVIPGIVNKTIVSLGALADRLPEFDYVLRTNLSSFYIFPRLLQFLQNMPKIGFYSGVCDDELFGSGAGFLMSRDVAQLLVENTEFLLRHNLDVVDDVLIGIFLNSRGIKLVPHTRVNLTSMQLWHELKPRMPVNVFQCRVKNDDEKLRATDELYIQERLVRMFYGSIKK